MRQLKLTESPILSRAIETKPLYGLNLFPPETSMCQA